MGIFDFLTPKTDGFAYDPMRLPAGADPENDPVVGYDELGQKIRRSRFDGTQYLFEMAPPKTQSVVRGAYREATANPLGFTGDLLSGAVQSAWDAISVPARSMAGEPITYGDIAGLTGMMTLGAGAATAPAGALRMGAAREGKPPVTFADAERAMQEAQGIRAYQGSPHNFAAERLVRMPDGSTQYIVGRPDVLPDVPAGAEVLQDFPLGRMRMDKIGTGEGNQAFGRGLYTAENERIARSYRDQLSRPYLATPDGQSIAEKYGIDVADIFENAAGDPKDLRDTVLRLRKIVKQNLDDIGASDVSELKPEFNGDLASTIIEFSNRADRLENLMNSGDVKLVNEGKIYEVSINAKPDDFINYDAPLSAQGQKVKEQFGYTPKPTPGEEIAAYELAKREAPNNIGEHPAVQDIYRRESAANAAERLFQSKVQGGGVDEAARIGLSQAGIPGIKYFDAGSRDKAYAVKLAYKGRPFEEGQFEPQFARSKEEADIIAKEYQDKGYDTKIQESGSRNFVVFDDKLISIVKKYGIAGAAVMLGTSADQISQTLTENMTQEELNNLVSGA